MFICLHLTLLITKIYTLGALEVFIESYRRDINVVVGDINVDFSRQSAFTYNLSTLMTSLDLIACD